MDLESTYLRGRIEKKSGGGCLAIFGLPFLLAGLFVMQIPLKIMPVGGAQSIPDYFFLLFGLPFAAVGAVLVFGRSGVIVDRELGLVTKWWGLLVPMKRQQYYLGSFDKIKITCDHGDSDSPTTYPVRLISRIEGTKVEIDKPTEYPKARQLAEQLASLLHKPVEDASKGKAIVREAEYLDESLRQKIKRTKEDVQTLPVPPANMETRISETGEGIILEIPQPSRDIFRSLRLVLAFAFVGVFVFSFIPAFFSIPVSPAIKYAIIGFISLFFIFMSISTARFSKFMGSGQTTVVTATRYLLRVERRGRKIVTEEILADELEDLSLPERSDILERVQEEIPERHQRLRSTNMNMLDGNTKLARFLRFLINLAGSQGITAVSDQKMVTFGAGLPEEELAYLHALLMQKLGE